MKINTAAAGHTGPVKNGVAEWLAYDNKLDKQLKMLQKALETIKTVKDGNRATIALRNCPVEIVRRYSRRRHRLDQLLP
jgi:hypothetical protein